MTGHMGKYIPGNPNFIVQNMGGAGSVVGANYVYNVSKPDGLSIGEVQPAIYFHQLLKQKEIKFDWARFTWLAARIRPTRLSISVPISGTRVWLMCAKQRSRRDAAPQRREHRASIS